jgi:signal transduction histidine kinase
MKALLCIMMSAASLAGLCSDAVVTNAGDLARVVYREQTPDVVFELDGTVISDKTAPLEIRLHVLDGTGAALLFTSRDMTNLTLRAGDRVRAAGRTMRQASNKVIAYCQSVERIGHVAAPAPERASAEDIESGRFDCRLVKVRGTLRDAFQDEIDGHFTYLVLNCDGRLLYVPAPRFKIVDGMVGSEIEVEGICDPLPIGGRLHMGRTVLVKDERSVKVLCAAGEDAFSAPTIDDDAFLGPMEIQALGIRRARGTVVAAWRPRNILISTEGGNQIRASIASQELPASGTPVEVAGVPETDLFNISLSRAVWRPAECAPPPAARVYELSIDTLLGRPDDEVKLHPYYNGRIVRIVGDVVAVESSGGRVDTVVVSDGGRVLAIDASAVPGAAEGVSAGCRIEATGACILETENWRPGALFPPANGYRLVIRNPGDLRVLARPPWWTPERLVVVIGVLASALAALLVWIAVKRSFGAMIEKAQSDARVAERTRLAVELHDSIAQNLTGVAMEIRSARRAQTADPSRTDGHLDLAAATLDSCRDELRNCIWDLRNLTLDDATVDEAVRRTLRQHLAGARLDVRFKVARSLLSDNALHTILRVVRELTINAVRHGAATEIKVAGCLDGDSLLFSVRDNGRGFDPAAAPGMREGHFGLQGIRERIEALEGTVEIESAAGRGTKVSVSIPLPPSGKVD